MTSEIFEEIVRELNRRMKHQKRKIILFVDNDPCYSPLLSDHLSMQHRSRFCQKATSRRQPCTRHRSYQAVESEDKANVKGYVQLIRWIIDSKWDNDSCTHVD